MRDLDLIEINLERYLYLDEVFKSFDLNAVLKEIEGVSKNQCNCSGMRPPKEEEGGRIPDINCWKMNPPYSQRT